VSRDARVDAYIEAAGDFARPILTRIRDAAPGRFRHLASPADLPKDLVALMREAAAAIEAGGGPRRPKSTPRPPPDAPPELRAALDLNPVAAATFEAFPPSCRREYVEWVEEAKRPETRARRVAQAVEWMAEGKRRNWKYENC
jgi:uncharacterized protein YdeI (YjbR/CyaY-like superfamily)